MTLQTDQFVATFVIDSPICGHAVIQFNVCHKIFLNFQSLSKTTKLLLLDLLLQEVCISSDSGHGRSPLSSLRLSVLSFSQKPVYAGLKKAHSYNPYKMPLLLTLVVCDKMLLIIMICLQNQIYQIHKYLL